ncbi:adenylosuccinate synthase [Sulfobacillus thermosulfidooxidans]|uniref:adenylosuccinate synthase n=1 Tax=Sulfobacillus thermosulfidooxidans TaxID=28034 RepID=UPI0006B47A6F|nr:adenylosuccinate synthase [Sulfobacillus thermosulfidooxidans]
MTVTAVVGANWGDEGKGKITDYLARDMDFVVRFQGGSNAGHTILNEFGKFALHMLPSGVFYPHVHNVLGPGVALNIVGLAKELQYLKDHGLVPSFFHISDRAQVVLPVHILLDQAEEMRLGANQFGSTRSGIAPFYADKFLKIGVQVADLFFKDRLRQRIERNLALKNFLLPTAYQLPIQDPLEITEIVSHYADVIAPFVCDTTLLLHDALKNNQGILLEGQLGALRDPDHGIYPFTTSSSPLAGFASVGAGIPPYAIRRIIAVTKAYSTCVGAGPFVTELMGPESNALRERGGDAGEYGATTGRPRRVGWFDAVATRYGCMIQGATEVALTNLDVLSYREEIPIATAYTLGDKTTTQFPPTAELSQAQPVFEVMPGWRTDITSIQHYEDLPPSARQYVERIETLIDTKIRYISVGPQRKQIVIKP